MEVDVAVGAFLDLGQKMDNVHTAIRSLADCKPIHKPVSAAGIIPTSQTEVDIVADERPAAGRVWNVRSAGVLIANFSPVILRSFTGTGSVTSPGAGATIVSLANIAPNLYNCTVTTFLGGTVAAADTNNMDVTGGSPSAAGVSVVPAVNVPVTTSFVLTVGNTGPIAVKAIAAATSGAIYNASITLTPIPDNTNDQQTADVFAGNLGLLTPDASAQIVSQGSVPFIFPFPRGAYWVHSNEQLFARVYNVLNGMQTIFVANVSEYPVEAVEALGVG